MAELSATPAWDVSLVDERDASLRLAVGDVSSEASGDVSSAAAADGSRCAWCGGPIAGWSVSGRRRRVDADTCSKRCRQNRWRWRVDRSRLERAVRPMRFGYADPPYPGRAGYYPEGREVDHAQLVERLVAEFPDGWALSTAADALRVVLGVCPAGVRVCSWHRAVRRTRSRRALSGWEPLIVCVGRELAADAPQDVTDALVARGRHRAFPGAMVGMKPPAFAVWMFQQLGARPGDELVDLYPGSGAVSRAWRQYASPEASNDASADRRPGSGATRPCSPRLFDA